MKVVITIDGRIVVDIDTESVPSASVPVLKVAEKPTPLTDEAQTTLDDHLDVKVREVSQWKSVVEEMGDIRIADIKPSGIKIIRCSICNREGVNARSHPDHGGRGPYDPFHFKQTIVSVE